MKYHVTIEADYWPKNVPDWEELRPAQRSARIREHCDRISEFLNDTLPTSTVRILVTDSTITIDPLLGDVIAKPIDALEPYHQLLND